MSGMTRRHFISYGFGALTVAGAAYGWVAVTGARRQPAAPAFASRFMTVAEMQATGALIVDIRRPDEWAETGVIDGARLVTFASPQSFLNVVGPELADGRPLILICRSGNRSSLAAEALASMIPNPITSVAGGMSQQVAQGYQTVRADCAIC